MAFDTALSVAELRRAIFGKDAPTRDDFLRALAFPGDKSSDYADLLADIAVDVLVEKVDPPKYVTSEGADWLMGALRAHPLPYAVEIRVLQQVLEQAVSLPQSLSAFLLAEIEKAVVEGRPDHPAGLIASGDVEALRGAVYATDEGAALHVTRPEAEALFRIAHAAKQADKNFDHFFAQAVGNHLMGIADHWMLSAQDKKQLEDFENSPAPSMFDFLKAMLGARMPTRDDFKDVDALADESWEARADADIAERAQAENVGSGETDWLAAHLTRDGDLTGAEKALLAFLKQEMAGEPPQALRVLFTRAGV